MKLFLDSAITEEIAHALDTWDMDGLTTNPRHVMVSGKPFRVVIAEIAEMVKGTDKPVSVEVNPHYIDYDEIVKQGRELAALHLFAQRVAALALHIDHHHRLGAREACQDLRQKSDSCRQRN